ncbi:MAG: ABC transporter ATP-binding protein [Candidatus Methylomirabilia bacterium]
MKPAIELVGVRKNFGATEIIRGVDWAVQEGELHAMIGPNGGGKSTLFNLITGKYEVTAGRIALRGEDITNRTPYEVNRKGLSRSFQVINIFPRMSVFENVRCGILWALDYKYSFWHFVDGRRDLRERTEMILEQIGMTRKRDVPAGLLSYADQRALELGITIAGGAGVLLLDEPTSGMSRSETEQTVGLIRKIAEGKTVIIVEHDMSVVFELADRISVLVYGEIIACDKPEQIRNNRSVQEAYLGTQVA